MYSCEGSMDEHCVSIPLEYLNYNIYAKEAEMGVKRTVKDVYCVFMYNGHVCIPGSVSKSSWLYICDGCMNVLFWKQFLKV